GASGSFSPGRIAASESGLAADAGGLYSLASSLRDMTGAIVAYPVDPGDKAPAFSVPTSADRKVRLADFKGQTLVIFFYPQDDTETCTKEALAFSEKQSKFRRKGVALLGVSPDTVKSHLSFIKKYDLKLELAADEDKAMCHAFGVWQLKKRFGREYMGV